MLLKEMIMETGINNILGAFYKHFDEDDSKRFLDNLEALLEGGYHNSERTEGSIIFSLYQDDEYEIYASYENPREGKVALYGFCYEELLNMEVKTPYFLSDAEAICIIIDDALSIV